MRARYAMPTPPEIRRHYRQPPAFIGGSFRDGRFHSCPTPFSSPHPKSRAHPCPPLPPPPLQYADAAACCSSVFSVPSEPRGARGHARRAGSSYWRSRGCRHARHRRFPRPGSRRAPRGTRSPSRRPPAGRCGGPSGARPLVPGAGTLVADGGTGPRGARARFRHVHAAESRVQLSAGLRRACAAARHAAAGRGAGSSGRDQEAFHARLRHAFHAALPHLLRHARVFRERPRRLAGKSLRRLLLLVQSQQAASRTARGAPRRHPLQEPCRLPRLREGFRRRGYVLVRRLLLAAHEPHRVL